MRGATVKINSGAAVWGSVLFCALALVGLTWAIAHPPAPPITNKIQFCYGTTGPSTGALADPGQVAVSGQIATGCGGTK